MPKFMSRPAYVEAFQMTQARIKDHSGWPSWMLEAWNKRPGAVGRLYVQDQVLHLSNHTGLGFHLVRTGDWIIRTEDGSLSRCGSKVFQATYVPLE